MPSTSFLNISQGEQSFCDHITRGNRNRFQKLYPPFRLVRVVILAFISIDLFAKIHLQRISELDQVEVSATERKRPDEN